MFRRQKIRFLVRFLLTFCVIAQTILACGLFQPTSEQGHDWIVPRPAAEIRLTILDSTGQRVPDTIGILHFGGEPVQDVARFVDYNPDTDYISDSGGKIVIRYLGETGGGYEVHSNAVLPELELELTSPYGQQQTVDIGTYLYRLDADIGETTYDHDGEIINMKIVADSIILNARD